MKKLLLSILFVGSIGATAQTTIFEDSFETYTDFVINDFGLWNGIDGDLLNTYTGGTVGDPTWANAGDPQAFQIFNPTTALVVNVATSAPPDNEVRNFDPRTGAKYAACWAAALTGGSPVNNDWLISPPITLGTSGNELRFWVKSMSNTYGLEKYRVGIYVGSDMPAANSFVYLAGFPLPLTATYPAWTERSILAGQLNTYNGQTVRFGIQCVSPDAYMFMVDDFKVTTTGLSNADFSAAKFSVYPNPANNAVTVSTTHGVSVSEVTITDVNGRTVKTIKVDNLSEVELNVSELTSGIYFMNLTTDAGKVVKKFVKS